MLLLYQQCIGEIEDRLEKEDQFMKETGSVYKLWCDCLDSIAGRKVPFLGSKMQTYLNDGGE